MGQLKPCFYQQNQPTSQGLGKASLRIGCLAMIGSIEGNVFFFRRVEWVFKLDPADLGRLINKFIALEGPL